MFGLSTENPVLHLKRRLSGIVVVAEDLGDDPDFAPEALDEAVYPYLDVILEQFPKAPRNLPLTTYLNRGSRGGEKDGKGGGWGLKGWVNMFSNK